MINFKTITQNKLIQNFSYLVLIDIFQKILPFITIPYIVSIVGLEKFGTITFSYAVMAYFQLLVDFGFNTVATKDISLNYQDKYKYSEIFWSIIFSKLLMFIVSSFILLSLLVTFEFFSLHKFVYIYAMGLVISSFLFPIWFFQGVEDMKYIAIFTAFGRILYTISIFLFLKSSNDYLLIPLFNSISLVLISLISFLFVLKKYNIIFNIPSQNEIKYYFEEGWHLFLSSVTTNLYTTTNTILLGSLTNFTTVGIYSLAATISGAATQLIGQFNKVIYPHLSKFSENKDKLVYETKKYLKKYLITLIGLSIIIIIFANVMIMILFGENHYASVLVLQVLGFTLTLASLGGFYTRYMIIQRKQRKVLKITTYTMVLNFILIVPLILLFGALGVAITKLIVESYQVFLNVRANKELNLV